MNTQETKDCFWVGPASIVGVAMLAMAGLFAWVTYDLESFASFFDPSK